MGQELKTNLTELGNLFEKIGKLYTTRFFEALKNFLNSMEQAARDRKTGDGAAFADPWREWADYAADFAQRFVLFWDVMRERGDNYLEHVKEGQPPLLAFKSEMIADGRTFARPVNYALIRIIPPEGVQIDNTRRPFIIVDPRAGHGPGIGGFKMDSEVGTALRFGHPVYLIIFFRDPEPGQTILDVSAAEAQFLRTVVSRHPDSPRPTIYGNCQGGWASMLIAANDPGLVGPVVINGAPMSYWSGSWSGNEGENPMRYSGGLLGGSWPALLAGDLGNGKFDGAWLVQNFENLNPANTFWSKYYNLWKNVDKERERFLEFEKWWGGYFLMNEEEIHWIVENLFIGNKLARGEVKAAAPGAYVDLKAIRTPVIIFSSRGDNITPPQQALNWISDVYSSTAEIKALGQVIIGLLNEDVGHLGIFVSGKVAQKEHTEIIEALDFIEMLRPGLYVMDLEETAGKGKDRYISSFREVRLEDLRKLNRLERKDEKPFEAVEEVSLMNEKIYSLYARPLVRSMVNETTAQMGRTLHPLRMQRWLLSDLNPMMWPLKAMAPYVRQNRKPAASDNAFRVLEGAWSQAITGSLNFYRDMRDAATESAFFQIYGSLVASGVAPGAEGETRTGLPPAAADLRELPYVKAALAAIDRGGYPEAVARMSALFGRFASSIPLSRLETIQEFVRADEVLSKISEDEMRRLNSEAGVLALLEPERTMEALPGLLSSKEDRDRALKLLEWAMSLEGVSPLQLDFANNIYELIKGAALPGAKKKSSGKKKNDVPSSKTESEPERAGR